MASNNAPKHDFAPAWLKIPNQENSKPPGTKQGKRFPPSQSSKFRHHSVDDDYYAYTYGPYSYYNGYHGYHEKYGVHYGSQPSLLRSQGQRDSKYQHPHARYGAGQPMNVGYQPYYDFLPHYEYYGQDPYYTNYPGTGSRGGSKRSFYEKEGRSNSKDGKEGKDEKKEKEGEKDKPFNDDFPSLNGGLEKPSSKGGGQMNGSGVWENPPNSKNGGRVGEEGFDASQSKVLRDTNIYKNLVPNKTAIPRRPARVNGSLAREQSPYAGLKPPTPTSSSSSPGLCKEMGQSAPMDILNTRFVTQPKTLADKKSHFLKTLRQEDDKKSIRHRGDCDLVNGVDSLSVTDDGSNLSSSLEAEQRLLREMGWNEDEEEYEITEDEKKEFQNLSKMAAAHQQRNGLVKNGTVVKAIPKTWSPKHIPVYQPSVNELNETLSSSDSDSDDALN